MIGFAFRNGYVVAIAEVVAEGYLHTSTDFSFYLILPEREVN